MCLCSSTSGGRSLQGGITLKQRTVVRNLQLFSGNGDSARGGFALAAEKIKKEIQIKGKQCSQSSPGWCVHARACGKTRKGHSHRSIKRTANQKAGVGGVLARCARGVARKIPPVGRSGGAMATTSRLGRKSALTRAHGTTTRLSLVRRTPRGARRDYRRSHPARVRASR